MHHSMRDLDDAAEIHCVCSYSDYRADRIYRNNYVIFSPDIRRHKFDIVISIFDCYCYRQVKMLLLYHCHIIVSSVVIVIVIVIVTFIIIIVITSCIILHRYTLTTTLTNSIIIATFTITS
jgi:hypothetical protein